MEAPASLESQVEGLKAQRGQLQQLLAASGGADPTLQSLLGQLDGTIEALEAEILKQRKSKLLGILSLVDDQPPAPSAATGAPPSPPAEAAHPWSPGERCVVRRWNGQYADAVILSIEDETCLLMWLHPRSRSELICRFFRSPGGCQRQGRCSFSHGERWQLSELHVHEGAREVWVSEGPPVEGDEVLAKDVDDVWYEGVIEEVMPHESGPSSSCSPPPLCMVRFHRKSRGSGLSETTAVEGDEQHMVPLHYLQTLVPASKRKNKMLVVHDDEDEEGGSFDTVRVLGEPDGEIFSWSRFSKGVGLRLLQSMGYEVGKGLGQDGRGRAEPIEIRVYPPGVSLDYIHEDADGEKGRAAAFREVGDEQEGGGKGGEERGEAKRKRKKSVFEVINQACAIDGSKRGKEEEEDLRKKADLRGRDEGDLRQDLVREMERRGEMEGHLAKLREMLARNEKKDPAFAAQVRARIDEVQGKLRSSDAQAERMRAAVGKKREARKHSKHLF